ncbi:MAG: hypothetical protein JXR88_07365 [Clostridia bacterium]|nr:hypothetical protein [Clostridia bacterium]
MKINKQKILAFISFIVILALFCTAAFVEYQREITDERSFVLSEIQKLTLNINKYVNQSVRNANGVVAFIQTYPDLSQDEFSLYAEKLMPSEGIISHFTAIKDTTIAYVYPYEPNKSAIGINLSEVEGQKEDILKIKNNLITMFVGPVELVQGGMAMIYRMPILVDQQYWGQLSMVLFYDTMLELSGVYDFAYNHPVIIEQFLEGSTNGRVIFETDDQPSEDALTETMDVTSGQWRIKAENPGGFTGATPLFYLLIGLGIIFATIVSFSSYMLLDSNNRLNRQVVERTEAMHKTNEELKDSIIQLQSTQNQLINKEKFATLGEMVSSTAHEINTPLGICVTVASYIEETNNKTLKALENNTLKKSQLSDAFEHIGDSIQVLNSNLERAIQLVKDFRKLSLDHAQEEIRTINLHDYVDHILKILSPTLKKTPHTIHNHVDLSIELNTYPGALFQIFTNLIMNSLTHAFENVPIGTIDIYGTKTDKVIMDYKDNGKGMSNELAKRIFEPFFTTKKDEGGTGLGMHIVQDLTRNRLNGDLELISSKNGVHFKIILPDLKK